MLTKQEFIEKLRDNPLIIRFGYTYSYDYSIAIREKLIKIFKEYFNIILAVGNTDQITKKSLLVIGLRKCNIAFPGEDIVVLYHYKYSGMPSPGYMYNDICGVKNYNTHSNTISGLLYETLNDTILDWIEQFSEQKLSIEEL